MPVFGPVLLGWAGVGRLRLASALLMSYLVDPASSHMLVFKTKPCKSKYKQFIRRNCRWLIKTVIVYLMVSYYLDNRSNSRANTCMISLTHGRLYLLEKTSIPSGFDES